MVNKEHEIQEASSSNEDSGYKEQEERTLTREYKRRGDVSDTPKRTPVKNARESHKKRDKNTSKTIKKAPRTRKSRGKASTTKTKEAKAKSNMKEEDMSPLEDESMALPRFKANPQIKGERIEETIQIVGSKRKKSMDTALSKELKYAQQLKARKFIIEKAEEKLTSSSAKLHIKGKGAVQTGSISQEFTKKLSKALIDTKKIITLPHMQTQSERFQPVVQSPHCVPNISTSQLPLKSYEESLKEKIKNLPLCPSKPLNPSEYCHVHSEFCGDMIIQHEDHNDYIDDGELHCIDKTGKIYPHKLSVSCINPDVCRPIGISTSEVDIPLQDIVTPHVII